MTAVHGVVSGHSASVSRAAPVHWVHRVVPSAFPVAVNVAVRASGGLVARVMDAVLGG